ncbi:hypothetical protein Tco_1080839 [Tanacetum coccineum]|uniref:Uncharacterized protein n=1 Tax=Tanacetum coccineum TaxID=301880 RepID=A0ABQ5HX30_9ASTR
MLFEFKGYGPENSKQESNVVCEKSSKEIKKTLGAPIIEDWVSDEEEQDESKPKKKIIIPTTAKIEFVRPKQQEKLARKPMKYAEMYMSQSPRGNQRNWNNQKSQQLGSDFVMIKKACYVCGSFEHLQYTCKHKRRVNDQKQVKPVWNNSKRVIHHYSTRITHPNPKRNMIPQAILMRSRRKTINAAKPKVVHNVVKASACWVWKPKNRVIDHVSKYNNALITLKRFDYIDAQGRFKSVIAWVPIRRLLGGSFQTGEEKMLKLMKITLKLMILLLKLKCTSEGVQQRQKIKKKVRGFPEQKTVKGLKTAGYRVTTAGSRLLLLTNLLQTRMGIGTEQTEGPKSTLEEEFQDLHLNLPVLEALAHTPIYNVILGDSKPFDTLADLGSCVNIIPLYLFKKLNIGLLEETDHDLPGWPDDCHLHGEWEIARDAEINPFKDVLVFRRMDKPPKDEDGAWHAKIRIIVPDGEEFTKTLQSIPTTRKLSERESPREIINLDRFYDT